MNGSWKFLAGVGATLALAAVSGAYGYGVLAGDVKHNATSIGKNESAIHGMKKNYQQRIEQLARDQAVATQKILNIESGIAEVLREVKKR